MVGIMKAENKAPLLTATVQVMDIVAFRCCYIFFESNNLYQNINRSTERSLFLMKVEHLRIKTTSALCRRSWLDSFWQVLVTPFPFL